MIDDRFYVLTDGGLSIGELCARLDLPSPDGTFADSIVTRPAALHSSQPGDLTFLQGKRQSDQLESAKASACFVPESLAGTVGERHIVPIATDTPKFHLARATSLLVRERVGGDPVISPSASVHETAVLGPNVVIGDNVVVGPHTVIMASLIGDDCQIGANTVIGGQGFGVVLGPGNQMLPVPHIGRVIVGDRVRIGSNACIDRGQLGDTVIGNGCQIDNLVQIAHNCLLGENCVLAGRVGLSGSCELGDGVMMGGNSGLADHIKVGAGARLAAFAGVMNDIPAGETWSGIPAIKLRDHMKIVAMNRRALKK